MAGREAVKRSLQQVRPILSVDHTEARRRVLNLYKAWYRQIPYIGKQINLQNALLSICYVIDKRLYTNLSNGCFCFDFFCFFKI